MGVEVMGDSGSVVQRVKCMIGLHRWNKWLPTSAARRLVDVRSCVCCGKLDVRMVECGSERA